MRCRVATPSANAPTERSARFRAFSHVSAITQFDGLANVQMPATRSRSLEVSPTQECQLPTPRSFTVSRQECQTPAIAQLYAARRPHHHIHGPAHHRARLRPTTEANPGSRSP